MYMALYRKWRPKSFEDVFGQENITKTIKNEIKTHRISHAYLFCGTRGTGKTSTAKIFAKAVNCMNPIDFNPCDECESCKSINEGNSIDVFEIDAASNRGIDDIRDLREAVRFAPTMGKYKVYIIDEVHMLTNEAFNALLKTLEEPPEFVLFILATTEPHKLPATILSRCQRFDFKRISVEDIIRRLEMVCEEEELSVEPSALRLIARNSDGALRDALSILDQCSVFTGQQISYDDVLQVLGIVNNELLFKISQAILKEDCAETILLVEELSSGGKDMNQFIKDLLTHYRNLLMTKVVEKVEDVVEMTKEAIELLKSQAQTYTKENIIRCINILSEVENTAKWSSQPRIMLEVALVKMCKMESDSTIDGFQARLSKLENLLNNPATGLSVTRLDYIDKEMIIKEAPPVKKEKKIRIKGMEAAPEIIEKWNGFMQDLKAKGKIKLRTYLATGKPIKNDSGSIIISYAKTDDFCKLALDNSNIKNEIEELASQYFGGNIKINTVFDGEYDNVKLDEGEIDIVQKAKDLFGEDLVEVIEEE